MLAGHHFGLDRSQRPSHNLSQRRNCRWQRAGASVKNAASSAATPTDLARGRSEMGSTAVEQPPSARPGVCGPFSGDAGPGPREADVGADELPPAGRVCLNRR